MQPERIRAPFRARPFRAFAIVTASGRTYRVLSPETMAIDPEDQVVVLIDGHDVAMIDIPSITEVTYSFGSPTRSDG